MLLLLVALIIAPTSFAQEFGYYVSRGRSVKDNEIDCQKLNNEGKKVSYCEQVMFESLQRDETPG
jgi:hypothetical protein